MYLPFAIIAYLLNSVSITVDKFLLSRRIPNPFFYIFYISLFSLAALILLPFTQIPHPQVFLLASFSTILWTSGAYFMFKALHTGQPSRVVPVIGTLIPVILAFVAFLTHSLNENEFWALGFLVFALVFLVVPYLQGKMKREEILLEVVAALFFANSYLILRQAYVEQAFLTVFVWSRVILIPLIVGVFLIPTLRKIVLNSRQQQSHQTVAFNFKSKSGILFFVAQAAGGGSELLLTYSISLAEPALVNSLQGTQYVFLFLFGLVLSKKYPHIFSESISRFSLVTKFFAIILISIGLFILAFATTDLTMKQPSLGITYSPRYAESLGLDPKTAYVELLDRLYLEHLRLPLYWDEIEKEPGKYTFDQAKFYLNEAQSRNIDVILVVGYKQPRWPECFKPNWVKKLSRDAQDQKILDLVEKEITYFKQFDGIKTWQVENEPLFNFGICEKVDDQTHIRLQKEVALVKRLDNRPILLTDSGELSLWKNVINLTDILGITLYRTVWNPILGLNDYPQPPLFYKLKNAVMKLILGKTNQPTIIAELQAEPWIPARGTASKITPEEMTKYFPFDKLDKNLTYAKNTGFESIYLWGAEWWLMMDKNGYPQYMDSAEQNFNQSATHPSLKIKKVVDSF